MAITEQDKEKSIEEIQKAVDLFWPAVENLVKQAESKDEIRLVKRLHGTFGRMVDDINILSRFGQQDFD